MSPKFQTMAFDPIAAKETLTANHEVSNQLLGLSRSAHRHYALEAPLDIGILNVAKRRQAFEKLLREMDSVRQREGLSEEETAMMLLYVVTNDKRCMKAMLGFHTEWNRLAGCIAIPGWMRHAGYEMSI